MRERLSKELDPVTHHDFFAYIMGPYKTTTLTELWKEMNVNGSIDSSQLDEAVDRDAMELLMSVRDRLRSEPAVNAFLAIDPEIPLDEMDAITQSIEFATTSNATIFIVPYLGKHLGVGMEVGAILERLEDENRERIMFIHEDAVRSATIKSVAERWDVTVYDYTNMDELLRQVRVFVTDIMNKEQTGRLPPRG